MGRFNNTSQDEQENGSRKMIFGIICVTVLFFILTQGVQKLAGTLCMTPGAILNGEVWRFVSSLLVNPMPLNLFFDMYALYIFGSIAALRIGGNKILSLYLCSGIAGNLLWALLNLNDPQAFVWGCSGAFFGLMLGAAMLFPELEMYLLFIPFPIKLRTLAAVFMILELILAGGTAFALPSFGGMIGGYLFVRIALRGLMQWDPLGALFPKKRASKPPYEFKRPVGTTDSGKTFDRAEIDRILDKLSRTGINSLTPDEIAVLEKVREQLNRKN